MGSRAYIARIQRDGSGQYIYLGHGCYPDDVGAVLLIHYSESEEIDALIRKGSVMSLEASITESIFYHDDYDHDWSDCRPMTLSNGTTEFFGRAYQLGPEWLYAWTPDGWLAAKVQAEHPEQYFQGLRAMEPDAFQDWFEHNQEPEWVQWRASAHETQRPQPLAYVIDQYVREQRQS